MIKAVFNLIVFLFGLTNLNAQNVNLPKKFPQAANEFFGMDDTPWKSAAISFYHTRFDSYNVSTLEKCKDSERDMEFDKSRKIRAINEIPAAKLLSLLLDELSKKQIPIDSILMMNSLTFFDEEGKTHFGGFYIFHGKKIGIIFINYLYDKFEVEAYRRISKKDLFRLYNEKDGCGGGYHIWTIFDKNYRWQIRKFIINPDDGTW